MGQEVEISISVVSHGQMGLVNKLLDDLSKHCKVTRLEIILTLNVQEDETPDLSAFEFPVLLIRNLVPMGFGANHNRAFVHAKGTYFCVLNPDIRLHANPFAPLVAALSLPHVGVVAPLVMNVDGSQGDSARHFPTPMAIFKRLLHGRHEAVYAREGAAYKPDWVGGMCMLFTRSLFAQVKGFDESYFLYYEDVDLCGRLKLKGWHAMVCPDSTVTHHAQHSSHKSLKYLRWHATSLLRFFMSATFMRLWRRGYL
jgi:GT2 family glycosyltransferase